MHCFLTKVTTEQLLPTTQASPKAILTFTALACSERVDKHWSSSLFRMFIDLALSCKNLPKKNSTIIFPVRTSGVFSDISILEQATSVCSTGNLWLHQVTQGQLFSFSFNFNFLFYRLLLKFVVNLLIPSQGMEK